MYNDFQITQKGKTLSLQDTNKITINKYENKISRLLFTFDGTIEGRLYVALLNPITNKYSITPILDNKVTITTDVSVYPGRWDMILIGVQDDYEITDNNIDQSKFTYVSDTFRRVIVRDNFLDEDNIERVSNPAIDEALESLMIAQDRLEDAAIKAVESADSAKSNKEASETILSQINTINSDIASTYEDIVEKYNQIISDYDSISNKADVVADLAAQVSEYSTRIDELYENIQTIKSDILETKSDIDETKQSLMELYDKFSADSVAYILQAKRWAVGDDSISESLTDNSKYYAQQALATKEQIDSTKSFLETLESNVNSQANQVEQMQLQVSADKDAVSDMKKAIEEFPVSSVQPDWSQNDETAKDYVKNRPFYDESIEILNWDGNTNELISVSIGDIILYRVSDLNGFTPDDIPLQNDGMPLSSVETTMNIGNDNVYAEAINQGSMSTAGGDLRVITFVYDDIEYPFYVAFDDNISLGITHTTIFPKAGFYTYDPTLLGLSVFSISMRKTNIKQIDEKFIPKTFVKSINGIGTNDGTVYLPHVFTVTEISEGVVDKTQDEIHAAINNGDSIILKRYGNSIPNVLYLYGIETGKIKIFKFSSIYTGDDITSINGLYARVKDGTVQYKECNLFNSFDEFIGATSTSDGGSGLVPQPLTGDQDKFLKGDGTWSEIEIPETLPNPQKLTFTGAVTAEYDGSGAVTVTIPEGSGGSGGTVRVEKLSTDTAVELEPNKLYVFPEMAELTITLAEPTDTGIANEYHFVFQSGATATTLSIPDTVKLPSNFSVDVNKIYEISIMEGCLCAQSWAVS